MKENTALFCFRPDTTIIHRAGALIKLPIMMGLTLCIFQTNISLLGLTILIFILSLIARIPLSSYKKNVKIIFGYALIITFFKIVGKPLTWEILHPLVRESLLYLWRLTLVFLTGSLFYETTSTLEIRYALTSIQNVIERTFFYITHKSEHKKNEIINFGLLLSLTISFIPRIFDTWTVMNRAWKARDGNRRSGLTAAWHTWMVLVPALFIKLMAIASDTDRAIHNRSA